MIIGWVITGFVLSYVVFCIVREKYEEYQIDKDFKSPEGLARQAECDAYNNGPGKIIREHNEALRLKYGHYAITDELSIDDLRKVILELSDIGYDLKKINPGHEGMFIAYLTFNPCR